MIARIAVVYAVMMFSFVGIVQSIDAQETTATAYPDHQHVMQWIDFKGDLQAVTSAAHWQTRRAHILAGMQQVMGPLPSSASRGELDMQVIEMEELPTLTRSKITYLAGPGDRIPAYLLIPKNKAPKSCPAMLCLHGTSGPRGRTAGLGADYARYALELAERGYVTIAPDYTLLGDNQTDPESLGYASGTMKGIWSHMRAVDLLESIPEVDASRMGTIGVSLGGHNSLFVSVFDERLKVMVTSSGFDSFLDYMNGNPTGWCQKRYMPRIETIYGKDPKKIPFDFPEVLAAIAPRAVYIHAPLSDSNFKVESAKQCTAEARKVFQLLSADSKLQIVTPPGEHGFPIEERQKAYEFVDRILKPQM
ncbi:MAG: dienelactone hydrolase family protein [Pirellulales bacterium]